jgi:hypothetical protein
MYLKYIGFEGENLIYVAQHREEWQDFLNMVINLRVP